VTRPRVTIAVAPGRTGNRMGRAATKFARAQVAVCPSNRRRDNETLHPVSAAKRPAALMAHRTTPCAEDRHQWSQGEWNHTKTFPRIVD
jgi:hypothetical protein